VILYCFYFVWCLFGNRLAVFYQNDHNQARLKYSVDIFPL